MKKIKKLIVKNTFFNENKVQKYGGVFYLKNT